MREPFELVHQNRYRVSCRPEPTPDGTFLARAVVSWIDDQGTAVDHRLRPELPPFSSAVEAANHGRDAAVLWLDAQAGAATAPTQEERDAYRAAHAAWKVAADVFAATMQQALDGQPVDTLQLAVDASALKRLHERWIEASFPMTALTRR